MNRPLAVIVAAGTGGHLYPGMAVARAMRQDPTWKVLFVVRTGDMGKALLEREGWPVVTLSGQGMPRGLSWKWLPFPFRVAAGFVQALLLLLRCRPCMVIGMGGYLSFPVLTIARLLGRRTLVHEQNVLPGLTNRSIAHWTDSIALSFPDSQAYVKSRKAWVSGLPIRADLTSTSLSDSRRALGLDPSLYTILVFGGSLGAHKINTVMLETWTLLKQQGFQCQLLHITGAGDFNAMQLAYKALPGVVHLLPYCHEMPHAYGAADLILCRAGASTIAELCLVQKPAILVPYPSASENHQLFNAEVLMRRFLAEVILDHDLEPAGLLKRMRPYLQSPERSAQIKARWEQSDLKRLHEGAAQRLSEYARTRGR